MLRTEDISVTFGGVRALRAVSFAADAGAIAGLIGPNGAGKTTLFNVITGLQRGHRGRVLLDGSDITSLSVPRRALLGIGRTFQRLELFAGLSARENLMVAAELRGHRGRVAREAADGILGRLGMERVADSRADMLPTGSARLVELGRALAGNPTVLLLDEPSSGLNDQETEQLGRILRGLADSGITVVLVEHDMDLVMKVCDRVTVLDAGEVISDGDPETVRNDPAVTDAYLGATPHATRPAPGVHQSGGDQPRTAGQAGSKGLRQEGAGDSVRSPASEAGSDPGGMSSRVMARSDPGSGGGMGAEAAAADAGLELVSVKAAYGEIEVLHGIDLRVRTGTVFALLGPNGGGKSTIIKVSCGALPPSSGSVVVNGIDVTGSTMQKLSRTGVCTVPEGRAIYPNLTVAENLLMWTHCSRHSVADVESRCYERFPILKSRRRQIAGSLSGGEQQMLAISRVLCADPKLLLVDELSMGLAPIVVANLYEQIADLAAGGITILLTEQLVQVALGVCDDAAVVTTGRVVARGKPADMAAAVQDLYLGATPAGPTD